MGRTESAESFDNQKINSTMKLGFAFIAAVAARTATLSDSPAVAHAIGHVEPVFPSAEFKAEFEAEVEERKVQFQADNKAYFEERRAEFGPLFDAEVEERKVELQADNRAFFAERRAEWKADKKGVSKADFQAANRVELAQRQADFKAENVALLAQRRAELKAENQAELADRQVEFKAENVALLALRKAEFEAERMAMHNMQ